MPSRQFLQKLLPEVGLLFPGLVALPGFLIQMPLTFDLRVLQMIGPGPELAGAALGYRFQM
jgi:hypothetical protein